MADDPTVKGDNVAPFTAESDQGDTDDANHTNNANGSALVEILREELAEKNRQISELHRLLAQTALNAAPPRPWRRFWR